VEYGPTYYYWILGYYPNEGIGHTNYTEKIKQKIHLFEPEQQERFYTPLRILERLDDSVILEQS